MGTKSTVDKNGNAIFNSVNAVTGFNGVQQIVKTGSDGKVSAALLPTGTEVFLGEWNAATNTPTLSNATVAPSGSYYHCNVAGTVNFGAGPITFLVGDHVQSTGTIWVKLSEASQPGRLLNVVFLTSGTSYTPSTGTNKIYAQIQGGGGAGGGCAATTEVAGGGGASGGLCIFYASVSDAITYTYSIGAGGVGASNSNGGAGGNTVLTISGTAYTSNGGGGGSNATATRGLANGGLPGGASNGLLNLAGWNGAEGIATGTNSQVVAGDGADSRFGTGGNATVNSNASGATALGFGAGGSGGSNGTGNTARAGGNGSPGCILIQEYS